MPDCERGLFPRGKGNSLARRSLQAEELIQSGAALAQCALAHGAPTQSFPAPFKRQCGGPRGKALNRARHLPLPASPSCRASSARNLSIVLSKPAMHIFCCANIGAPPVYALQEVDQRRLFLRSFTPLPLPLVFFASLALRLFTPSAPPREHSSLHHSEVFQHSSRLLFLAD